MRNNLPVSELYAFVQDDFVPAGQAALLISDLSIQRGYGMFDFFKTLDHAPVFLEEHLDRFFHSAAQLRLTVPKSKEVLKTIIHKLQEKNDIPNSGIRMTLTGGYSSDGYILDKPNLIISQQPLSATITAALQKSIRLVTYPHRRQMPDIKTIDYLMGIWLQPYIREKGADDVLYHQDGLVSECPRSNFFIVTEDDTLVTPARDVLKGIIRMKVLELASRQFKMEERDITLEELQTAKEAFITSTTKHILPVSWVDDKPIGTATPQEGVPGKIAQWLNQMLYELVKATS